MNVLIVRPRFLPRRNKDKYKQAIVTTTTVIADPVGEHNSNAVSQVVRQQEIQARYSPWSPHNDVIRRFVEPAMAVDKRRVADHIVAARTAYAEAFVCLMQCSKNVDAKAILETTTADDVAVQALELAKGEPAGGPVSKFVDVLHHYQGVFDVIANADFSYLPLIWGAMKLVLIMTKNRIDLMTKFREILIDIGMSLSRLEVWLKIFPIPRMVELTSRLYASVVDFLKQVAQHFQGNAVRKYFSSISRPSEEKFGQALASIRRWESHIREDVAVLRALRDEEKAMPSGYDSYLQRHHLEAALAAIPKGHVPELFIKIKSTLFEGFEHQANYHDSLASTYNVTSGAWSEGFSLEQRHLPSGMAPSKRLSQGLCDAPDSQHALQWAKQQLERNPDVPSAYIIWAPGMTAHSAIASLIYQILQQRPQALSEQNLDLHMFNRANVSITALWDLFTHLMRTLNGCLIYISMGSAGPEEFVVVAKFIKTVEDWDGPPICVTLIHPFNEGFLLANDVKDLDEAYDVHPSLTTTDAIHHVLMLELAVHDVSTTIRDVLWETVWRETRYAVIGIGLAQLTDLVQETAKTLAQERVTLHELDEEQAELWHQGLYGWANNRVAENDVREQIQRHLDIVSLRILDETRKELGDCLKRLVLGIHAPKDKVNAMATKSLTQDQRDHVWERIGNSIRPATFAMFCGAIQTIVTQALDTFSEAPLRTSRQATLAVIRLFGAHFGREGGWRTSLLDSPDGVVRAITDGLEIGFADVIEALLKD